MRTLTGEVVPVHSGSGEDLGKAERPFIRVGLFEKPTLLVRDAD